jgi:hypothetical protein
MLFCQSRDLYEIAWYQTDVRAQSGAFLRTKPLGAPKGYSSGILVLFLIAQGMLRLAAISEHSLQ